MVILEKYDGFKNIYNNIVVLISPEATSLKKGKRYMFEIESKYVSTMKLKTLVGKFRCRHLFFSFF